LRPVVFPAPGSDMTQIVNSTSGVGDHSQGPFHRDPEPPPPHAPAAPTAAPAAEPADVRLIIEDDGASGGFVYTTVDHRTGAVIRQLPRDRLLKLGQAADYAARALIKTRV
jgi:flagellar protein FlaG